jgi:hypothetical protein
MGGLGPMLGQNHHFRNYAPEKIPYAINRRRFPMPSTATLRKPSGSTGCSTSALPPAVQTLSFFRRPLQKSAKPQLVVAPGFLQEIDKGRFFTEMPKRYPPSE